MIFKPLLPIILFNLFLFWSEVINFYRNKDNQELNFVFLNQRMKLEILLATQALGRAMTVNVVPLAIHVARPREIVTSMENVLEILNVERIIVGRNFPLLLIAVLLHENVIF